MNVKKNKLPYIIPKTLSKIAAMSRLYITQDSIGYVHIWRSCPSRDDQKGYWEGLYGEIPLNDDTESFCLPYVKDWKKSLITPHRGISDTIAARRE